MTPHTPVAPPYHDTVTIDSDNEPEFDRRREYYDQHQSPIMIISGKRKYNFMCLVHANRM